MDTSETSHPYDFLEVEIRDPTTDATLTTLLSTDDSKADGVWIRADFPLDSEYGGRGIRLHFSADVADAKRRLSSSENFCVNP